LPRIVVSCTPQEGEREGGRKVDEKGERPREEKDGGR